MLNFSYRFKRYESEYFSTLHIHIKSDITFYRIPISKTYEAPTFTHPIPFEPKKLHTVKEKLYGVQYQSVTQRTYLPFVGVCKRKVGIEKKRNIAQAVPESESCV